MIKTLKAVVFDLDGTLIDSAPDITACVNQRLAEDGFAPYDVASVRAMIGGGVGKLIERAYEGRGRALDRPARDRLTDEMIEIYAQNPARQTRTFPGAGETLKLLSQCNIALGLCTNKPHAITSMILDHFGWSDYFGAVIGGDSVGVRKPDPAPLAAVLNKLGARPEEAVMIGDSGADSGAAAALNMRCILLTHGYSKTPVTQLGAEACIDSLSMIADLLALRAEPCPS